MAFYLEKGSKWASVNRLTDLWLRPIVSVTPVNTLSVSEPIKAVCENKKQRRPNPPLGGEGRVVTLPPSWVFACFDGACGVGGVKTLPLLLLSPKAWVAGGRVPHDSYLVDPASSHMLVSKIKPCMSKYKQLYTVKLQMAH